MGSLTGRPAGIVYGWEPLRAILAEPNIGDLIREHYEELGVLKEVCPLDPDFDRFVALEDAGVFKVWTVRADGMLVGYLGWFIQPHMHYRSTLHAVEDLYLLSAPYRGRGVGFRMFNSCLKELKAMGVVRCICHSKNHFEAQGGGISKFLTSIGFEATDTLWMKAL